VRACLVLREEYDAAPFEDMLDCHDIGWRAFAARALEIDHDVRAAPDHLREVGLRQV
jgi:hypothetical protein